MNTSCKYEIGALLRPDFRRACFMLDLAVQEQKGFLSSAFMVRGESSAISRLNNWLSRVQADTA